MVVLSLYSLSNKSFPLCPNCYCNPPEGLQGAEKGLCTTCPMDDRHPIIEKLTVCDCPESEGVLIVDPVGGPNWKLVSTRSPLMVAFPAGVNRVSVLPDKDESGCHMLEIDFNERKSNVKLPGGGFKYVGSLSDPFLEGILEYRHGTERGQVGRRGRGKGRRGRGRGRGRGKVNQHDLKMSFYGF